MGDGFERAPSYSGQAGERNGGARAAHARRNKSAYWQTLEKRHLLAL
jgi:hypothetical protein